MTQSRKGLRIAVCVLVTASLCGSSALNAEEPSGLRDLQDMQLVAHLTEVQNRLRTLLGEKRYTEAAQVGQEALSLAEEEAGPQHPLTALSLKSLAKVYQAQGQAGEAETDAEAEALLQRALAIYEQAEGPEGLNVSATLLQLAALYAVQGKDAESRVTRQRATSILEKVGSADSPMATQAEDLADFLRKIEE